MSAMDITVCTTAGNWHFDGHAEQMNELEKAAFDALCALLTPGRVEQAGKPSRATQKEEAA